MRAHYGARMYPGRKEMIMSDMRISENIFEGTGFDEIRNDIQLILLGKKYGDVYREVADGLYLYPVYIREEEGKIRCTMFTESVFKKMDLCIDRVILAAAENMKADQVVTPLPELLNSMLGIEGELFDNEMPPIYVITNQKGVLGASHMIYRN